MGGVRSFPATIVGTLLAVASLAYTIYTPTNVLLGLLPAVLFVGTGYLVDRYLL